MSTALAVAISVQAEAPGRIKVIGGSHMAEALRRLPHLDRVPPGCHALRDWHLSGAFVVVDPNDRILADGATYAMQWDENRRPSTSEVRWQEARNGRPARWGIRTPYVPDGFFAMGDDLSERSFAKYGVGKVVGILCNRDGSPMTELWPYDQGGGNNPKALDPTCLPESYHMICEGDCLMPVFENGTRFRFSITGRRTVGSYIALWRKPELTPAGQHQALIKRLLTPLPRNWRPSDHPHMPPVIIVETLNPHRSYVVPLDQVAAVHKCEGVAPPIGGA